MTRALPDAVKANSAEILVIVPELIQPGDILLTQGDEKNSYRIAWGTWGPFAHAGLFISAYYFLESLGDGIGISPPVISKMAMKDRDIHVIELEQVKSALLLRYSKIGKLQGSARYDIADDLAEFSAQFIGLKYPKAPKLFPAVAGRARILRKIGELLRFAAEKIYAPDEIEGPFCSELIALCYQAINRPLFPKLTRISPNDLYRCDQLVEVKDSIFSRSPKVLTRSTTPREFMLPRNESIQSSRLMQKAIKRAQRF